MQKASLDGTLETQIKEAASKIQPVREVMIRRVQLMQSGVITNDGPTLEQVLEDEQAKKKTDKLEDEQIEEDEEIDIPVDELPDSIAGAVEEDDVEDPSEEVDYESMTVAQLKELLKEAGKPVSGKKAELIERLKE